MGPAQSIGGRVRRVRRPPYTLDRSRIGRFRSSMTIFRRVEGDRSWERYKRWFVERIPEVLAEERPGYILSEYALAAGRGRADLPAGAGAGGADPRPAVQAQGAGQGYRDDHSLHEGDSTHPDLRACRAVALNPAPPPIGAVGRRPPSSPPLTLGRPGGSRPPP